MSLSLRTTSVAHYRSSLDFTQIGHAYAFSPTLALRFQELEQVCDGNTRPSLTGSSRKPYNHTEVIPALGDGDPVIRAMAADVLGELENTSALAPLERALSALEQAACAPSSIQEMVMDFDVTLGATFLGGSRSHFLVWAPLAHTVQVHIVAPHERLVPLERGPRGYHQAVIDGVEPGSLYLYRLDDHQERPDPA